MYDLNESAYRFEEMNYDKGLFDECIDATYIIHLENNGRYEHIQNQLKQYQPSKKVFLLWNKGYTCSKKQEYITRAPLDLVDAFYTCFQHAKNNNHNTILILEDDFIFVQKYLTDDNIKSVSEYVNENKNEKLIYKIGCFDYSFKFTDDKHFDHKFGGAAHSVIYSKSVIDYTLNKPQEEILDWDDYTYSPEFNKKMFYKPLCIQSVKKTENRTYWHVGKYEKHKNYLLYRFECFISDFFLNILKFDRDDPLDSWELVYNIFNIYDTFISFIRRDKSCN